MLEAANSRIATSIVVVRPCCDPTEGKVNKHRKLCLGSLHNSSICKLSRKERKKERKKESMSAESTALVGQRTLYHEEKESRHRAWIFFLHFLCSYKMLLYRVVSSIRPLFGENPQNGARKVLRLTSSRQVFSCLSFPPHNFSLTSSKLSHPLPSFWCRRKEHPFPLVTPGTSRFFFSHFPLTQSFTRERLTHLCIGVSHSEVNIFFFRGQLFSSLFSSIEISLSYSL